MSSMVEELLGNENFVSNILKAAKLEEAQDQQAEPEDEEDDYKRYKEYMERRQAYDTKHRNREGKDHLTFKATRKERPSQ
jgi:hypothetical protein